MTALPDIAKLLEALEKAWEAYRVSGAPDSDPEVFLSRFFHSVNDLLAAIRSARAAGYRVVLLSESTVEALRVVRKARLDREPAQPLVEKTRAALDMLDADVVLKESSPQPPRTSPAPRSGSSTGSAATTRSR